MKKRFLVTALTIALIVVCAFGLFACAQKTDDQTPNTDGQKPTVECTHNYGQWTSDGDSTHSHKCSKCGKTETQAHQTNGDKCSDCGYVYPSEIHTEHSFTNYVYNNDATCTADGTETAKCDGCNERDTRTKKNTKLSHSFTNYQSNNDWTCTQDGTKTAKCDNCNERDTIADKGSAKHMPKTAVKENNVEPTYETDGSYDLVVRCYKCNEILSSEHITVGKLMPSGTEIHSKSLTVEGDRIYGKFANGTDIFRFAGDITVADGARYYLCSDILGTQVIPTKIAPLQSGDNTFYIVVENGNNDPMTYTVTLRVRPMYTVAFNAKGGVAVQSQTVEEDDYAVEPTTSRTGYAFDSWDYDFAQPITSNTQINASWTANTDTAYTVEYYLENVENTNFSLYDTEKLNGTTDTTATAEIKDIQHFTYNENKSQINGNIDADGSKILKVYYTRKTYTLSNSNSNGGNITNGGTYKYGTIISTTVTPYIGYDLGWYDGDLLVSDNFVYSFEIDRDIMAQFTVKAEMQNYEFTATATTCNISNVKDKTITSAIIPDYVTTISSGAFGSCNCLETFLLPFVGKEITELDKTKLIIDDYRYPSFGYIFGTSRYTDSIAAYQTYYYKPRRETYWIGKNETYYIPTTLKNVTITGGTCIYEYAFAYCSSLTSITIPNSVTSIRSYAFAYCSSLTSITIPSSVTSIWSEAFYNCSNLTSIEIPNSVTSIGSEAFYNCSGLTSITIPSSVTSIGNSAFRNCSGLTSITADTNNPNYSSQDGILYNKTKTQFIHIPKAITDAVTIPYGVTSIGSYAFSGCSGLTSITIPSSVTSIEDSAFSGCSSLTSITIPSSVTSIGSYAFRNCSSLANITVQSWNTKYHSDGNCIIETDSKTLILGCKSSLIPADGSVTSIGSEAFYNCSGLTSITIPSSVTSIGNYAFYDCSSLTNVNYIGTIAQWCDISKGSYWKSNTGEYTVYCSDGNLTKSQSA